MWTMAMAEASTQQGSQREFVAVNPKSFLGSKMVKEAYGRPGFDLSIGANILKEAALSDSFANANGKYFDNDYGVFSNPHHLAMHQGRCKEVMAMHDEILKNHLVDRIHFSAND